MSNQQVIGVFDSGFGGLTVLRALLQRIPQARYAFLGDTARLPYGSKSRRTIARYAAESAQFLVREQGAEYLVIACNTASALALDAIQDAVPVPVLGVIEPGAASARVASRSGDVLVIATDATVSLVTSVIKISVFGLAGVVTPQVLAFAVLIGAVSLPGAFLARTFVERMPVHIHAAILDVAVIVGGVVMISSAVKHLL